MFQPTVIGSGLVGWQFLQSTIDRQQEVFRNSALIKRDTQYFREEIGKVQNAEQLVSDRRLLSVALGAFGLKDDVDNRFFIRKILEGGTNDRASLANRLSDERYKSLANAFDFESGAPAAARDTPSIDSLISRYERQEFEVAIGNQDQSLRLAMNFNRGIREVVEEGGSDNANWFKVMGTPPLRTVIEKALGLPGSFGQLDLDLQRDTLREKTSRRFGVDTVEGLLEDGVMRRVLQTYFLQQQVEQFRASGPANVALTLLQSVRR